MFVPFVFYDRIIFMLEYNEIRERKIIIFNDEPCEVIEAHVARTQQRKPQNQVKLKSLMNGRTFNTTFHSTDKVDEAEINKREIKFLYHNRGEYWFCDIDNPKNRFKLDEKLLGDQAKFLKENMTVTALVWGEDEDEKMISVKPPIKVELRVKDAPPSIKGDTAGTGGKQIVLETGAVITAPLFINTDDMIVVNTETGLYVERV
jgi:elongation factor P